MDEIITCEKNISNENKQSGDNNKLEKEKNDKNEIYEKK